MRILKVPEEDYNQLLDKVLRYEKALLDIVDNPKDVSKFSYQEAYTSSVRIAVKALRLTEQ